MRAIFKFLASIRLAVPLLLIIAVSVAMGTVLESMYSASYARLMVYDTVWFYMLMGLLGVNILFAALSRWPWKGRHAGFVITHAGLLILLAGAFWTSRSGIDGELRLVEGSHGSIVELPGLQLTLTKDNQVLKQVAVPRSTRQLESRHLGWLTEAFGHGLLFKSYVPFSQLEDDYSEAPVGAGDGPAIGFWLKSPFFNTSVWLDSRERSELQMGPAQLRLIRDSGGAPSLKGEGELRVIDRKSKALIMTSSIENLRTHGINLGEHKIQLVRTYQRASVVGKQLIENEQGEFNPAAEILITAPKGRLREVSFARFSDFSLLKGGEFPYLFQYRPGTSRPDGNLIEFHYNDEREFRIELYKQGQLVLQQSLSEGGLVETPWMGMKVIIARILSNAVHRTVVKPLDRPTKGMMPPSAYEVALASNPNESFWLTEGDALEIPLPEGRLRLNYENTSLQLPFSLKLNRFVKRDYAGTDKALSFESHVLLPETDEAAVISMNNPLVRAGFTLYQSSFQMLPDRPPVSILSVNRDPGRPLKYLGGIVTSLGIVIYVLMRSRVWASLRRAR